MANIIPGWNITTLAKALEPFLLRGIENAIGSNVQEGPGIDIVSSFPAQTIGLGGDTILLFNANGDPVEEYAATEAGLGLAIAAAASGDRIECPAQITIACTSGITIPAGVNLKHANLSFSGFAGVGVDLSAGSSFSEFYINYNGTGQASATAVRINGVAATIYNGNAYASNATTNIAIQVKGAGVGTSRANANIIYGNASGGTTSIGIKIFDDVRLIGSVGEASAASSLNTGIQFAIVSQNVDDFFIAGWGKATNTNSYGMQVLSGTARIVDGSAYGATAGLRVESGATANLSGLRAETLSNAGAINGEYFVGNNLYFDDNVELYQADVGCLNLRNLVNNTGTKLLIQPRGTPSSGDSAIHIYYDRTGEGGSYERGIFFGPNHGANKYQFLTADSGGAGQMLPIIFGSENLTTVVEAFHILGNGDFYFPRYFEITEIAAPGSPSANILRIYAKDDGGTTKLYYKRSTGTEVELGAASADEKAKVSANDTTAGYLNGKLVAGSGITLTENNDGSNETLTITGGISHFELLQDEDGNPIWDENLEYLYTEVNDA